MIVVVKRSGPSVFFCFLRQHHFQMSQDGDSIAIDMEGSRVNGEANLDGTALIHLFAYSFYCSLFTEEECDEEDSPFGGPKPMLPYSSMFIFSSTNM